MPLSLRFVLPLALALAAIAYAVVPLVDRFTFQWFVRDLDARGALIAKTSQDTLVELLREPRGSKQRVQRYFDRILQGERVYALGFCDRAGKLAYATSQFPASVRGGPGDSTEERNSVLQLEEGPLHVSMNPVVADNALLGTLVVVHDLSVAQRRSADTRKYILYLFAGIATVVALITVVIAEISWRGWVAGMRALLKGDTLLRSPMGNGGATELAHTSPELRPIARDLQALVRDLEAERH